MDINNVAESDNVVAAYNTTLTYYTIDEVPVDHTSLIIISSFFNCPMQDIGG